MPSSEIAIGIDLGTTNSCVAVYQNNKIEIIQNSDGHRTTPITFCALSNGISHFSQFRGQHLPFPCERVIGEGARKKAVRKPENTIFDAKRLIGRRFDDPELQSDLKNFPFKVVEKDSNPNVKVVMKNEAKHFTPEEISAIVLGKMKETAEIKLGHEVNNAVITVPAYFNDGQRQATKDAAKIAGLNVIGMINEPTAAALAFGLERKIEKTLKVLIFDLCGGTFDVSIVTITPQSDYKVNATTGDTHFGGSDFDQKLMEYIAKKFKEEHSVDISRNPKTLRKLRTACEITKRSLSNSLEETVTIDALINGIDVDYEVTRSMFEQLCADLFKKVLGPVERALKDAKFDKSEIDEIVLVGGSTRIPKIQQLLKEFFSGKNLSNSINPDEAVAYGAAAHAAILSGVRFNSIAELRLHDVTPLSLGIQMKGQLMSKVIPRNTPIPIRKTQHFIVSVDNQSSILFEVYEGERPNFIENHKLGEFQLDDIASLPHGRAKIEVAFVIDENGILTVSAVDLSPGSTGKSNSIIIKKGRLDPDDIKRMIKDAENSKIEDNKKYQNQFETVKKRREIVHNAAVLAGLKFENPIKKFGIPETVSSTFTMPNKESMNAPKTHFGDGSSAYSYTNEAEKTGNTSMNDIGSSFQNNPETIRNYEKQISMKNAYANQQYFRNLPSYHSQFESVPMAYVYPEVKHLANHEKDSGYYTGKHEPCGNVHQSSNEQIQEKEKLNKYLEKIEEIIKKDELNLPKEDFTKLKALWRNAVEWIEKNPSADYGKVSLKYSEVESNCNSIFEKSRKRVNEEKRILAKYKLQRYLEMFQNRLRKEKSNLFVDG